MFRLKITFLAVLTLLLVGFAALVLVLVHEIMTRLTPSLESDLRWKADRGAAELSRSAELGVLLHDREMVEQAFEVYTRDSDVEGLVARNAQGEVIAHYGRLARHPSIDVSEAPHQESDRLIIARAPCVIEGARIGSVEIVISKARLWAGAELERNILLATVLGAVFALLSGWLFVQFRIGPLVKLTERAFSKLEKATEKALESSRLKSEFLANMSHEIRTPMNGILAMTELALQSKLDGKQRRYLETIHRSTDALMVVINDILDFSKLEAGRLKMRADAFNLRSVLEDTCELLAARAHSKGIELTCHIDANVPVALTGDADRLRQVFMNLIGNAVKFTDRGEIYIHALALRTDVGEALLRFEVIDTGIGIPEGEQQRIFDVFSQVDGSLTRKQGGTGLGLSITRAIVQEMGGRIGVESAPSEGSTFWVEVAFPKAVQEESSSEQITYRVRNRHVLFAGVPARLGEMLKAQLDAWQMQVTAADEFGETLSLLAERAESGEPIELLVVDSAMAGGRGAELLDEVGKRPLLSRTAAIYLHPLGADPGDLGPKRITKLVKPVRRGELRRALIRTLTEPLERHEPSSKELSSRPAPRREIERRTDGAQILVAEDNAINQEVAEELLSEFGYRVTIVENGRAAVETVVREGHRYDLVLMDCQMPGLDGYAATEEIRRYEQDRRGRRIPIVACTAHALAEEREKALAAGMDDYLTKPIVSSALRDILERWASRPTSTAPRADVHRSDEGSGIASAATSPKVAVPVLELGRPRSKRLLELSLKLIPEQVIGIRDAISQGDPEDVRARAHKLKGGALALGALALADSASRIEISAKSHDKSPWETLLRDMNDQSAAVVAALRGELEQKNASA